MVGSFQPWRGSRDQWVCHGLQGDLQEAEEVLSLSEWAGLWRSEEAKPLPVYQRRLPMVSHPGVLVARLCPRGGGFCEAQT